MVPTNSRVFQLYPYALCGTGIFARRFDISQFFFLSVDIPCMEHLGYVRSIFGCFGGLTLKITFMSCEKQEDMSRSQTYPVFLRERTPHQL